MVITAVRKMEEGEKAGAAVVTAADYRVTLGVKIDNIEAVVAELMTSDTMEIERTSKRKTKVVNIRPNIYSLSADNSGAKTVLEMRIATGSANNLKAELVSEYIYKHCGIEFNDYELVVERLQLLKGEDGSFTEL
jgi:hypothetical protein